MGRGQGQASKRAAEWAARLRRVDCKSLGSGVPAESCASLGAGGVPPEASPAAPPHALYKHTWHPSPTGHPYPLGELGCCCHPYSPATLLQCLCQLSGPSGKPDVSDLPPTPCENSNYKDS